MRLVVFVVLMAFGWSSATQACGPDFPERLLDHRAATLLELPDGHFTSEAQHFVPRPSAPFVLHEAGNAREQRLPPTTDAGRRYELGAQAYRQGDTATATAHFLAVLEDKDPKQERAAHAAYMLGHYPEVRALVQAGAPDLEGLAIASLGQQARELLFAGEDIEAIRMYAEQAAYGSLSGAASLLMVVRQFKDDPVRLNRALKDPLGQKLVTTYLWTRGVEIGIAPLYWDTDDRDQARSAALLEAVLAQAKIKPMVGVDALAASLYRAGRYEAVRGLLPHLGSSALAWWVRARMAVRDGQLGEADAALQQAWSQLTPTERWPTARGDAVFSPRSRLLGERATLALAEGRFEAAARLLLQVRQDYWHDWSVVAERVLTVSQLKALVDHAPLTDAPAPPRCRGDAHDVDGCKWDEPLGRISDVRALLGRRLLRVGRLEEALAYFSGPELQLAKAWVEAKRAAATKQGIDRAESLWRAAQLTRKHGLELLGTEVGPDWAEDEGRYDRTAMFLEVASPLEGMALLLEQVEDQPFVSAAEKQACREHAPQPPLRFHYRYLAAGLAEEAASLVPPRSQAYAALLCTATQWTPDPEARARLYRQYLTHGALVDFAAHFGQKCPLPDWSKAKTFTPPSQQAPPRKLWRKRYTAGVLLLLVGCGVWLKRRRQRA